jgi:hypothetical protein
MENNNGDLNALIQEKIDADADFQVSLADLSDVEKEQAVQAKKAEVLEQEVKSLRDKAEKATKAEELANNYKIRAEKAEQELKKSKPADGNPEPKKDGDLTSRDILALSKADIHEDDIEDVLDFVKYQRVKNPNYSIAEALKSSIVKATLAEKKEFRATQAAANAGAGRRGSFQKSDDTLLNDFSAGKAPETDEEMDRLAMARLKAKAGK